jgi:hypothetical protein
MSADWRVPRRRYHVRRRRSGKTVLLVARDQQFEVDSFTDQVWRSCDGLRTLEEIGARVAATLDLDPGQASMLTVSTTQFLERLGLLTFDDESGAGSDDASRDVPDP